MKKFIIAVAACALVSGSFAKEAGFQASLVPDIAVQDKDTTINGFSIGIWNENPGTQWQWGLVNGAKGDSAGLQFWLPIIPIPTFYNYAENYTGAQIAIVNWASGEFVGAQLGAVNGANDLIGAQLGIVNYAKNVKAGVQLSPICNYTETVTDWCFQLGLVNIIGENEWFKEFPGELAKGMVFVNWSFK